jgi:antirestriction protein ArdC
MINNRFNVVYHLLGLVKLLFYKLKNIMEKVELTKDELTRELNTFSERDVDFAYLCGVFNVSGIDGLHKEIQRLKAIGKDPHDIIEACRKQ